MPYIWKQPVVGNFQVCDAISVVNCQAAYTMQVASTNVSPESAFHMLVSLNGVLQKPGSSFTISGSTITFASNLVTNDVIDFIILLGDVLNIGTPSDDTVATASIQANAVTAAKFNADVISGQTALGAEPADTDEFLISDAGTLKRIDYSYIKGGVSTPYVSVGLSSDQSLSDDSAAKVQFDSEIVDSDSKFASNRFTPTVSGKYFVSCNLTFETDVRLRFDGVTCYIYKNGSAVIQTFSRTENNAFEAEGYTQSVSGIVDCDTDDYIEIYAKVNVTANTPNIAGGSNLSCLTIFKIAE